MRPRIPRGAKVPEGAGDHTVGSNQTLLFKPPENWWFSFGACETTQSWLPEPGPTPARSLFCETVCGRPDCPWSVPENCQFPNVVRTNALDACVPYGMSHT